MAAQTSLPGKHVFLDRMLSDFHVVCIHFDGLREDVRIPEGKRRPATIFEIGLNLPVPIHDLHSNEHGIYATLSFNRTPFATFVPWDAIFAISDKATGKGIMWTQDMPEALKQKVQEVPPPPPLCLAKPRATHLRLVK